MKSPFATKITETKTISIGARTAEEKAVSTPDNVGELPVDVLENKHEIRVLAPLAGVDIDAVEIVINNDVLTIRGRRELDPEATDLKGVDYYTQECFWGAFSRSVILPLHADSSQIEATEKNHVLCIKIPKKPSVQMRIVKIKPRM